MGIIGRGERAGAYIAKWGTRVQWLALLAWVTGVCGLGEMTSSRWYVRAVKRASGEAEAEGRGKSSCGGGGGGGEYVVIVMD